MKLENAVARLTTSAREMVADGSPVRFPKEFELGWKHGVPRPKGEFVAVAEVAVRISRLALAAVLVAAVIAINWG
jgi:hypothetical protein